MPGFSFFSRGTDPFRRLEKYELQPGDLEHFRDFVLKSPARSLYKANPKQISKELGWELPRTLDLLTLSAAEQLWKLEWDAFCGACGGHLQAANTLGELHTHQECKCGWQGEICLDQQIAVYASVDGQARRLDPQRQDDAPYRAQVDEAIGRTSALNLVNRPLFRDLLGEETLPGNRSLGVQHLAVFFSDLKGSTAMYQALGDAQAYQLVRAHFEVIFTAVENQGGSAVKTIGDGVMGTFFDSASALRGIAESLQGMELLNQRAGLSGEDRLRLKVGLHAGPCIVVTLNHRLDYFGSTVNIASRLSSLAQGNDLIISHDVLDEPEADRLITTFPALQDQHVELRGLKGSMQVHRIAF